MNQTIKLDTRKREGKYGEALDRAEEPTEQEGEL